MDKTIEPKLKTIGEYLKLRPSSSEHFHIPSYQRAYSWSESQCDKLWQDIVSFSTAVENNKDLNPYFFGTIIVDSSDTNNSNKLSLIDGQQRTITFIYLIKALLLTIETEISKLKDANDSNQQAILDVLILKKINIYKIFYKDEELEILNKIKNQTKIQGINYLINDSMNELYKDEFINIIEAKDFVTAEINAVKFKFKKTNNKYTNHFRNFNFFYKKLNDDKSFNKHTLNTFAETLLNKCQVIEIKSWQENQAITMFNSLNSTGMPLSDADIISAKLYNKVPSEDNEKKVFIDKWQDLIKIADALNSQSIVDLDSILQQYMYYMRSTERDYTSKDLESTDVTTPGLRSYFLEKNKKLLDEPFTFCDNITKFANIWREIKSDPLVIILLKLNVNSKLFLSNYLFKYKEEDVKAKVFQISECLLRLFILLEISESGYSNSKFKTFLFFINNKLTDTSISIEEIKNFFDEHITKAWKYEKEIDHIKECDNNTLVYINDYLYAKNKQEVFTFDNSVNVEHIMPSSGRNKESIRKDANINTKEEFEYLVNKLGNKILLEEDINKSISNDWFRTKKIKSIKEKAGYKDSKFKIALDLTDYSKDNWTAEDINTATDKAATRIANFIFDK
ncbi:MAG: DUF262 domain-containing HNH endonuclease family protein [Methylacidiphilales bacterium]|nr:DUF262 domain-containing HNH endonuclease family protein [Candidatus Methylacidiphilales bacterium]